MISKKQSIYLWQGLFYKHLCHWKINLLDNHSPPNIQNIIHKQLELDARDG